MDIGLILGWVAQYGFPIVMAVLLYQILKDQLVRLVAVIEQLERTINSRFNDLSHCITELSKTIYELKGIIQSGGDRWE